MSAQRLSRNATEEAKLAAGEKGCGFIMLLHGKFALVDSVQLEQLSRYAWRDNQKGYVTRKMWDGSKNITIYMHREITNASPEKEVDHKNKCGWDNRRENLRICTRVQNLGNAKKTSRYGDSLTSRFKGVRKGNRDKRWLAYGTENYKMVPLGRFEQEESAAKAYNAWAEERFGEFAQLNKLP